MKSRNILILGICLVVGIIGILACQGLGNKEPSIPPGSSTLPGDEVPCDAYRNVPLGEAFEIQPSILLEKAIAPAYFEFGNLVEGARIDSWGKEGRVSISGEDVCYFAGDPIWILLYNGTEGPMTFNLECRNAPLEVNTSDLTGKDYAKAPEGMLVGVTYPPKVSVAAGSAVKVPITVQFPIGLDYPDQWEFRIFITDLNVPGMVGTTPGIRFFCTMEK